MILRQIIIVSLIIATSNSLFGQQEEEIIKKVEQAATEFRNRIKQETVNPDFDQSLIVEFRVDTFKIGEYLRLRNELSTKFIHEGYALYKAVQAYGELVGKYYNLLLDELTDFDKRILKNSQSSWLEYKQNELILNENLGGKDYGNNLIENEIYINKRILQLNKDRAEELFHYLLRISRKK